MQVGRKIRDLRLRRGLTVQQLATACGLSKGFISQVENDHTSLSLGTLADVARALAVSVGYLVVDEDPVPRVVRAGERVRLGPGAHGGRAEVVSAMSRGNLGMLLVELPPGATSDDPHLDQPGEKCVLVLDGRVSVTFGEHTFVLETGDSLHFDGRAPHAIENSGEPTARVVVAVTPAALEPGSRTPAGEPGAGGATVYGDWPPR